MKTYPPVETFVSLRKWIGYVGVSLPLMVALLASCQIQPSISDFYYTHSRNWFVGSLFTIGAFLGSYWGYDFRDRVLSLLAGGCAFGVALCPTDSCETTNVGRLHYIFAALLFVFLAWFSAFQFTQSSSEKLRGEGNKRRRNNIYRICAGVICAMLLLILLWKVTGLSEKLASRHPVFWFESIALWAFGFSWMVKGEFILRDEEPGMPWSRSLLPNF